MRVFIYGLVLVQYIGTVPALCRFLVHNRKYPTLNPNDMVLVDETTAVLLVRGGQYKKIEMETADILEIFKANENVEIGSRNTDQGDTLGTDENTAIVANTDQGDDIAIITPAMIQSMTIEELYPLCEKHSIKGYKHKKQRDIVALLLAFYS